MFLNWLNFYKEHHAPLDNCEIDNGNPCKVCLFYYLAVTYWGGDNAAEAQEALDDLGPQLYEGWKAEDVGAVPPLEGASQEDTAEYFESALRQIIDDTIATM